jgi:hypothetical protein
MNMNFYISKKVYAFIAIIFVFFSVLSTSCEKKSKSDDNEVVFDTIQVDKTQSIDYKKSKLNCNLHIAFTYPVACKKASQLSDLQKLFIEHIFPPQYVNLPPQDAVNDFSAQYVRDFQSIKFKDYFDDDYILEDENNFIYELNLENEIVYNRNGFISFVVKIANYEGGAHGSNNIYGYVIELNTGKILTEEDFAGNNYKNNLSSILVQKIAAAKGVSNVSQLESIGYNAIEDIVPNENFTIDDKGITYYFNEYEIAAYFVGITEVFISYEELKTYITNDNPISSLVGL